MPGLTGLSGLSGLVAAGYAAKVLGTARSNLVAYWPLWEASGAATADQSGNGRNGSYTGVDLGQMGIGDGRTAPFFDGVNDYCDVYSTSLRDAFNKDEGTQLAWCKVNDTSVWGTASVRRITNFRTDANNRLSLTKPSGTNALTALYVAGGVTKTINAVSVTSDGWLQVAMTWSKAVDEFKFYLQGSQVGATVSGLGTWVGTLGSTATLIGAGITTPTEVWHGWLAHVALWSTPLSGAQIAALAVM